MQLNSCITLHVFGFLTARLVALVGSLLGLAALAPAIRDRPLSGAVALGPFAWHWRLDVAAAVLLVFVAALGWVVARFCASNLRGRPGGRTEALLCLTLVALAAMVTSDDLVVLAAGWTVSGLAVTGLIARSGTTRAPDAARFVRRHLLLGDTALWLAVGLLAWWFGTSRRSGLAQVDPGQQADLVAVLVALACLTRSALVPAHRWLQETAEAPSPVSGLLHAGIVNGAGVLGVLTWPLLAASPGVLLGLLVIGGLTVAVGAWAGSVRRDVKGRLAWSTTGQMGFMTVQLGLGLPAMALMHVIAHGSYKSWLFLRAGGAVDRRRHRWRTSHRPRRQTLLALVALTLVVGPGAPAAGSIFSSVGAAAIVPMLLGACAAAAGGWHAGALERVPTPLALAVATLSGLVGAAYLWLLRGWERLLESALPVTTVWSGAAGVAVVGGVLLAGGVVLWVLREVQRDPLGRRATALLPFSLGPGRVSRRRLASSHVAALAAAAELGPEDDRRVVESVERAAATTGPGWPLRSMVAANPLSGLEHLPVPEALARGEAVHGVRLRPALEHYLALHAEGRIRDEHLVAALAVAPPGHPADVGDLLSATSRWRGPGASRAGDATPEPGKRRLLDRVASPTWARRAIEHEGVWLLHAWADTPTSNEVGPGPFVVWREAAHDPVYDRVARVEGAAEWVAQLPTDPARAVGVLASVLGLDPTELEEYVTDLFSAGAGWSAHAAWRAREAGTVEPLVELVALRMAHDVLFASAVEPSGPSSLVPPAGRSRVSPVTAEEADLAAIWQDALELGEQSRLVEGLDLDGPDGDDLTGGRPASQSLWCIDVRSERVRRHLEAVGDHETYGFAGFFGAALRHTDADGTTSDRCPAILEPALQVTEDGGPLRLSQALHRAATSVSRHPLAALAVADGGGILCGLTSLATLIRPDLVRRLTRSVTTDETLPGRDPAPAERDLPDLPVQELLELAHGALTAVGLVDRFAPVILVCGHGATIENNAFVSAYDCGACGGHSGAVNATILAAALNDPEVRIQLSARGVRLPDDTVAVAALHDTTTDGIRILGPGAPMSLLRDLHLAGEAAGRERLGDLPGGGRSRSPQVLRRRAADWSEPTPEWGLAGNAALVIGPRSLTRGTPWGGRVFLHSYDRRLDPGGEILALLLTAPLVVAQWINAQYHFSTVAPELFGSGDKTTHNVVGDVGVLTGARGDLRTGLPWQALARHPLTSGSTDGLVHTPVRLTVIVAADPEAIGGVVHGHDGLRRLVTGRWVTLLAVDDGRVLTLGHDLAWRPFPTSLAILPGVAPATTTEYA